jgi:D-lactate dehydrogenase
VGIFEEEVQDNLALAKNYVVVSVFIYSQINESTLNQLPKLKMVATRSTGTDHIDMELCKSKGILVASVPEYGTHTVAEYTLGLILAVTKKICVAHQAVEEGEFSPNGLTGIDLFGSTLGVVGVGRIGSEVVKLGRALGMRVLGVEKNVDKEAAKKLHFEVVNLETCLGESDIVTLHVPSIPQTRHLVNKVNIKLMKRGSYLINTCRGPVVESEALIWALNNGILAGAGLDVIEEEALIEQNSIVAHFGGNVKEKANLKSYNLLRNRDDVVFTPHNAFNTNGAISRIVATTIENINSFLAK